MVSEYFPLNPTFIYYFRTPTTIRKWVYFYDRNKQYLGQDTVLRGYSNQDFTLPSNTSYVRILIQISEYGYSTYQNDICINISDADFNGRYEPYQGQQYTADFGETVHGGKWHVTKGGTDKTLKNVEYSDNTGIERNNGTQYFCDVSTLGVPMGYLLSNKFKPITDASEQSSPGVCYINADGKIRFNTAKSYDSVTEMIADIGAIQFSYELATPTTISTPKQNVPMLQGINTVYADCGDTSLKYQPDNVIGELKGMIQEVESEVDSLNITDMLYNTFIELGIEGEFQIDRINNEIHVVAIIDDNSIATQTSTADLETDLPDTLKCKPGHAAEVCLRHSSGTGKIILKYISGDNIQKFELDVEEVNTTSGVWFPIYQLIGKAL